MRGRAPSSRPGAGTAGSQGAAQLHRCGQPHHARRSNKGSFVQGYNAQAAVDSKAQIIVAAEVTQETTDNGQLLPMLDQVKQNMGRAPDAASADAGYWSEANVTDESVAGIDLHIATGRDKHGGTVGTASSRRVKSLQRKSCGTNWAPRPGDPFTKCAGNRRAGLRTDQGAARLPALQPARRGQRAPRVETGVPGVQSAEAVWLRMGTANRLKVNRGLVVHPATSSTGNPLQKRLQRLYRQPRKDHFQPLQARRTDVLSPTHS